MATNQNSDDNKQSGKQGFASMDPERQREIASQGGRASHSGGGSKSSTQSDEEDKGSSSSKSPGSGKQGGSSEQHAEAGRQSHKNTK
jgi:uncharacterized protein